METLRIIEACDKILNCLRREGGARAQQYHVRTQVKLAEPSGILVEASKRLLKN